ncbi:MAG: hypothetical protein UW83_C0029G0006 [Parcubacteria group bacterium GW2011_GWD1_44_9]|nr:MAG: hypothetical protein UV94_C0004G0022 [Parcubacteria group bacterium GW2011_GWC1_43_30]KKT85070.1 MAG: hypothetical protein UW83_C0029G0006 [Parcubacteria group bacterium GW2011_GWD1_44_9]
MWKNNKNSVNKMLKEKSKAMATSTRSRCFTTYPQINHKQKNKIRLTKSLEWAIHIFTPLIVVINFYI